MLEKTWYILLSKQCYLLWFCGFYNRIWDTLLLLFCRIITGSVWICSDLQAYISEYGPPYWEGFVVLIFFLLWEGNILLVFSPSSENMLIDVERGKGREREREKNIDVKERHWSIASHTHDDQGLNSQLRHVPWLGIEPLTFWFMRWYHKQLSHTIQGKI